MKESLSFLTHYLKKEGKKNSGKRNLIINSFLTDDRHYSVEELYQKVKRQNPKISLSTVYRTLKLLANCGLAHERRFDERNIRFEPVHQEEHHDHLVCLKCGRIFEFTNQKIEKLQDEVAKRYKFNVIRHKLEIYGYCPRCQK
jgi:Fur family ferric uptake transcriptional regulator